MNNKLKKIIICVSIPASLLALAIGFGIGAVQWYEPLSKLAEWLRACSLGGNDALAWAVYLPVGALPLLVLIPAAKNKRLSPESLLPLGACALLFWGLYLLVNPALIKPLMGEFSDSAAFSASLLVCLFGLLFGYMLLSLLRRLKTEALTAQRALRGFVYAIAVVIILSLCANLTSLIRLLLAASETNSSVFLLILRTALLLVPDFFAIKLVFAIDELLSAIADDPFGAALTAGQAAAKTSATVLKINIGSGIAANLLQLFFAAKLGSLSFSFYIPLLPIGLSLALLLLVRYFGAAKAVKEETDMFI